jgi:hypothetical protein
MGGMVQDEAIGVKRAIGRFVRHGLCFANGGHYRIKRCVDQAVVLECGFCGYRGHGGIHVGTDRPGRSEAPAIALEGGDTSKSSYRFFRSVLGAGRAVWAWRRARRRLAGF